MLSGRNGSGKWKRVTNGDFATPHASRDKIRHAAQCKRHSRRSFAKHKGCAHYRLDDLKEFVDIASQALSISVSNQARLEK
ncbi:MAG: hypothetical protein K0Q87_4543 [Neobacillus sp.]|nr:hypothetical protein [Neobacillus sp.]